MSWDDVRQDIRDRMTEGQAAMVRRLRVDRDLTWRGVAEDFYDERPEELYGLDLRGNQAVGEYLCEAAAAILGEDAESPPWN